MRIAVTVDPEIPVPPTHYGGIERVVDALLHGLADRGVQVTLLAHPESTAPSELVPYPARRSRPALDLLRNASRVSATVIGGKYDLVHSFGRLAYMLPFLPLNIPKLMSYGREISPRSVAWGQRLSRSTLHFSGCSRFQIQRWATQSNFHVVYNGVPASAYHPRYRVPDDAPLVFLGRVEEIKGPDLAIDVANRTGRRLIIAGNVPDEPKHRAYFSERIQPHLRPDRVEYVGPVTDAEKDLLLGEARALLFPDRIDEPFGLVMAESLACGTPVIALRRGAVEEIVDHLATGFVCSDIAEMADSVEKAASLDRRACRQSMERSFSDDAMVRGYLRVYEHLLRSNRGAGAW